ncbi:hypothetical protein LXL04_030171 [Taraxacum kok-saghyz]
MITKPRTPPNIKVIELHLKASVYKYCIPSPNRELGQPRSSETRPHRRAGSEFRRSRLRFGGCSIRRRTAIGFVPYRYADRESNSELCDYV